MLADREPAIGSSVFHRAVVERAMDPVVVVDEDLILRYAGPSITGLLGWRPAQWVGRSIAELLDGESLEIAVKGIVEWNDTGHDPSHPEAPVRIFVRNSSGGVVPVDATILDSARTGIPGFVVQLHPAMAAQALSDAVDMILMGADADTVLWQLASLVEHDIARTVATLGSDWDGDHFATTAGDDTLLDLGTPAPADRDALRYAIRSGQTITDLWDRLDGDTRARATARGLHACWCSPLDVHGRPAALIVWHTDQGPPGVIYRADIRRAANLTRLALQWSAQQHQLLWDGTHDQLTGLTNRAEFQNRLDVSDGTPRAALFCDLDDFKPVNERLGHRAGDEVLAAVAGRLAGVCSACVVARLGGDEFAILMDEATDIDDALHLAHRIRSILQPPIAVADHLTSVGVTIGIAFDGTGTAHTDLLMDEADRLLRLGKSRGKNQVQSAVLPGPGLRSGGP